MIWIIFLADALNYSNADVDVFKFGPIIMSLCELRVTYLVLLKLFLLVLRTVVINNMIAFEIDIMLNKR